ncbi:hypothetical protein [Fischerella thermalis]|uniref:Uncharacterized protein n=1 Tax=Fischerella thermalis CCMEE 5318 TaxID=2019666 RepID=A0A2N6L665_9CYAN|nr:hypothetical protein [Fischerella thermalis]PMB17379.1 hypothetical protein CEN46_23705 [Fischerella thermalis CCMEE 5318]
MAHLMYTNYDALPSFPACTNRFCGVLAGFRPPRGVFTDGRAHALPKGDNADGHTTALVRDVDERSCAHGAGWCGIINAALIMERGVGYNQRR